MDNHTLSVLEFDKIIAILTSYAHSDYGINRLQNFRFYSDISLISKELKLVMDLKRFLQEKSGLNMGLLYEFRADLEKIKVQGTFLPEMILYRIASTVNECKSLKKIFCSMHKEYKLLADFFSSLQFPDALVKKILTLITNDFILVDHASEELAAIRRKIKKKAAEIDLEMKNLLSRLTKQNALSSDEAPFKDGTPVLAVKANFKGAVKGVMHSMSASGKTLYIEPERVVFLNNQLTELKSAEHNEVVRILKQITRDVHAQRHLLIKIAQKLSQFDALYAKAKFAVEYDCHMPALNSAGFVSLMQARHPLLGKKAVPLDIRLGKDFTCLLISGPNTGGKTVTLKTTGLLVLMTETGIPIPASGDSDVCLFNNIFVDIGDEQSIERSLSTFSSHMVNIIKIIENVDAASLVLMDELGVGTDPEEGTAIAIAILEYLKNRQIRVLCSSHYPALKYYAANTDQIMNAAMEFDMETFSPTYHLSIGLPGQSKGIEMSSKLGLLKSIIRHARTLLGEDHFKQETLIQTMLQKERALNLRENEIRAREMDLKQLKEELALMEHDLKLREKDVKKGKQHEYEKLITEANRRFENLVKTIKENRADNTSIKEYKETIRELKQRKPDKNYTKTTPVQNETFKKLEPGDEVFIISLQKNGVVIQNTNNPGVYNVRIGLMKMNIKQTDMKKLKHTTKPDLSISSYAPVKPSSTLNLRQKRFEDAEEMLIRYLDDCLAAGMKKVFILHGKGEGILKSMVWGYLKKCNFVASFDFEMMPGEKSKNYGVTEVNLKDFKP